MPWVAYRRERWWSQRHEVRASARSVLPSEGTPLVDAALDYAFGVPPEGWKRIVPARCQFDVMRAP